MIWKFLFAACFLLCSAVFITTMTSIAKECYDSNSSFANTKTNNNNFLTGGLVGGPLCIIVALVMVYYAFKA